MKDIRDDMMDEGVGGTPSGGQRPPSWQRPKESKPFVKIILLAAAFLVIVSIVQQCTA